MAGFFYKYIVKTNIFIALGACSFYGSGSILLFSQLEFLPYDLLLVIFFSTIVIYTLSQNPISWSWPLRKVKYMPRYILIVAVLVIGYFSSKLTLEVLLVLTVLGLISVLYNTIAFSGKRFLPLRSVPLLKLFLISLVWAGVGGVLPTMEFDAVGVGQFTLLIVAQFLFIIGITLPFDIRDFYKDYKNDLVTIPAAIGIQNTKTLAYIVLTLHWVCIFLLHSTLAIVYLPLIGLTIGLVKRSSASRPNYYYTFFIDGLIILQFLVFYFYTNFI